MFTTPIACLALAIYFEARSEPLEGQAAVASVIINRVLDERFPNTVCEVVTQGPTYKWKADFPVRHRCQFSFYCDGKSDTPKDEEAYQRATLVAMGVAMRTIPDFTNGATHYHATYVNPSWASSKRKTAHIGYHIFYKWEK